MAIEFLVDFGYDVIEKTWMTATIFVKVFLFLYAVEAFRRTEFSSLDKSYFKQFYREYEEVVLDYSYVTVFLLLFAGLAANSLDWSSESFFPLVGEALAWIYLFYLFWEF